MPDSRMRKGSMADMMAKVPVNKGSLLAGLENLLKTIESSESTVMIPTLLRDKCEFDAWELLFVAKILKASILGHSDLVEFYVNHISHQKSLLAASQAASSTNGPPASTLRQASSPALSPAMSHRNGLSSNSQAPGQQQTLNGHQHQASGATPASLSLSVSSASSVSSQASTTTAAGAGQSAPTQAGSWTALPASQHLQPQQHSNQQQQQQPQLGGRSDSSSLSSCSSQSSSAPQPAAAADSGGNGNVTAADIELALLASRAAATAAPSVATRTPQPPSLLQLTTTNNHINSMVNLTAGGAIEQLASSTLQLLASGQPSSELGFGSDFGSGALSISTASGGNQQQPGAGAGATVATTPNSTSHQGEFRSSRSAGCLFRNSNSNNNNNNSQSGASSPRAPLTPTTPTWPQAETLANGGTQLPGDPSVPVKLLLQIEQLKTSIAYVAGLLESVVELYKKSIDNIAS